MLTEARTKNESISEIEKIKKNKITSKKFTKTPAIETNIIPNFLFVNKSGFIGTGFAHPKIGSFII